MTEFYDRDGNPINRYMWRRRFEMKWYQVLKQTQVGEAFISTVWLGMDHSYGMGGPPLIFETMVFGWEDDEIQRRYQTEQDALADHDEIVAAIKETVGV